MPAQAIQDMMVSLVTDTYHETVLVLSFIINCMFDRMSYLKICR